MKNLSEKTIKYLYMIRSLNPEIYKKMIVKIGVMDEEVSSQAFDIPEEKREVYHSHVSKSPSDKWSNVYRMGGDKKPYLRDESVPIIRKEACSDSARYTRKMPSAKNVQKKVSVYIDAENIGAQYAERIMELVLKEGKVKSKKYYRRKNDEATVPWENAAKKYNIKPILINGKPEKNKIDNRIKKDIRKSISEGTAADIICIITSDSGYVDIVKEIKKSERQAIVIGEKKTSKKLRKAAAKFIEL